MRDDSQLFGAVIAATDAVSARDPNRVVIDGPAAEYQPYRRK